jgi:hypothetical protein
LKRLATLAALGLAIAAGPASANIMSATYTGAFYAGVDVTGVFAAPGTDMTGTSFVFNFVYDTAAGNVIPYIGGQALLTGGGAPMLSSTLTVLGKTVSPSGLNGYYSMAASIVPDYPDPSSPYNGSFCNFASAESGSQLVACMNTNDALPGDLDTPFVATAADTYPGFADAGFPGGGGPFNHFQLYGQPMTLEVVKLSDSLAPGVPEPATWSLMILGFGATGSRLRRRRERLAQA